MKSTSFIAGHDLKGLREFAKDHPQVRNRLVVCLADRERRTEDGIRILPYLTFLQALWNKEFDAS